MIFRTCFLLLGLLATHSAFADDLPLVFEDDFEAPILSTWRATDPTAWMIETVDRGTVLSQHRASVVQTPVRSPFNRIVVDGLNVTDFQLDVDVQSTLPRLRASRHVRLLRLSGSRALLLCPSRQRGGRSRKSDLHRERGPANQDLAHIDDRHTLG